MAKSNERLEEDLCRLRLSEVTRTSTKELGRGSYATVFQVNVNGTLCAAKEMHGVLASGKGKHYFLTECVHSSRLLHPNLVQFIGIHYPSPGTELPWMIMELMHVSLTGLIDKYEKKDIPLNFKLSILVDVSQGLQFLHGKNIAHRDLSSNNVLLTRHYVAKVADLGMAKFMERGSQKHTLAPGTQVFMPPEALSDVSIYGFPIDVFSLGCVTVHLVSMQWPTPRPLYTKQHGDDTGKMTPLTEQERRKKYFVKFEQLPALKKIIEKCLQNDPNDRPVAGEVVNELKAILCDMSPNEDSDIIELSSSIASIKEQLQTKEQKLNAKEELLHAKEQELAERSESLQSKQDEVLEYSHQLDTLKPELIQVRQKLAEANTQLAAKHTMLAEHEQLLQAQSKKKTTFNDDKAMVTEENETESMSVVWLRNFEIEDKRYHEVASQEFKDPIGISTGPNSEIAVLDSSNMQVVMFEKGRRKDPILTKKFTFREGDGKISNPHDIAVGDDIIAVSDWSKHVVKLFSLDGEYQQTIGSTKGDRDGQLNNPFGLAFNSEKVLYVVDCSNFRVQAFDTANDNVLCAKFGSKGSSPGKFNYAAYVTVDCRDLVYVTDYNNHCISVFAADDDHHDFLCKMDCNSPWPIAFTPDDYMLVSDYKKDQICVFSPPQQSTYKRFLMSTLGKKGSGKGRFNYVSGISVDKEGIIYIAEYKNRRFQYIRV